MQTGTLGKSKHTPFYTVSTLNLSLKVINFDFLKVSIEF
jgi:hypothetical protein